MVAKASQNLICCHFSNKGRKWAAGSIHSLQTSSHLHYRLPLRRKQHFNVIILLSCLLLWDADDNCSVSSNKREKWPKVSLLWFLQYILTDMFMLSFNSAAFCKMEGIFKCCLQGKWKRMQSSAPPNKTIRSSSVCSGGVSLYIQIYPVELSSMSCYYSWWISLSLLLSHVRNHVETSHLLLVLLSGISFEWAKSLYGYKIYFCTKCCIC